MCKSSLQRMMGLKVGQTEKLNIFRFTVVCFNISVPLRVQVNKILLEQYLNLCSRTETIQLIQQLQHSPLNLTITSFLTVKPLGTNGIQLIDKDDSWQLFLGQGKCVPYQFSTISDEHLHKLGTSQF